jgi:hypothetical protein
MKAKNKTKPMNHQRLSASARPMSSTSAKPTAKSFLQLAASMAIPREHRERLAKFVAEQRIALPWF